MAELVNILIIEDNPDDVKFIRLMLANLTYVTTVATSLSDGLHQIISKKPNVILLDLNLPDSRGLATFKDIYKHAKDIPIIVLSAITDNTIIFEALHLGAQTYLLKEELSQEALLEAIRFSLWCYS